MQFRNTQKLINNHDKFINLLPVILFWKKKVHSKTIQENETITTTVYILQITKVNGW